ncbi:MAG TPA: HEAT repeat domain-containing protein [Thermoanaerobaculia bacterium]|nr:HEAT repeat domain-containing protein [Thermoanaerobaculia bacterium]
MRSLRTSVGLVLLLLVPAPFAGVAAAGHPTFASFLSAASEAVRKDDLYRSGQRALDAGKWTQAADLFGQVVKRGGPEVDAALYWQAYALHKAGRRTDALAVLQRLAGSFKKSAWLDDAKALEIEIRGGGDVPDTGEDAELKLYAVNSLMGAEPERAVPMLRKFLDGRHSPKLKEQALFVLSQSDSPEARQILLSVARGSSHPELQLKAVEYLGISGDPESMRVLRELYAGASDGRIKRAVLQSYLIAQDAPAMMAVAREEKDDVLWRQAVNGLGALRARKELRQLYQEVQPALKGEVVEALGIAGDVEALLDMARQEKDAALRGRAVRSLGVIRSPEASKALRSLYEGSADPQLRGAVIEALFIQDNAKALIEIYRSEKDRQLRRTVLGWLSRMDNQDAEAFLLKSIE